MTVLRTVDRDRGSTEDRHVATIKLHCKVIRNLTANAHNHTTRAFKIKDIHYPLETQLIEIETVTHIIVRGDCLRVIVDHDRLVPMLAAGLRCID